MWACEHVSSYVSHIHVHTLISQMSTHTHNVQTHTHTLVLVLVLVLPLPELATLLPFRVWYIVQREHSTNKCWQSFYKHCNFWEDRDFMSWASSLRKLFSKYWNWEATIVKKLRIGWLKGGLITLAQKIQNEILSLMANTILRSIISEIQRSDLLCNDWWVCRCVKYWATCCVLSVCGWWFHSSWGIHGSVSMSRYNYRYLGVRFAGYIAQIQSRLVQMTRAVLRQRQQHGWL